MEPKEKRKSSVRYAPEVRERAVRMVREHAGEHASQWEAIGSIAAKIGCTAETLRKWVRQAERDRGPARRPDERRSSERIKALERENPRAAPSQRDPAQGVGLFCDGGARPPLQAMIAFIDDHRAGLRGRADLPRAADRPVDLLRTCRPAAGSRPACRPGRGGTRSCGPRSAGSGRRTSGSTGCARSGGSYAGKGSRWRDARSPG